MCYNILKWKTDLHIIKIQKYVYKYRSINYKICGKYNKYMKNIH